jgi:cytochrome P450
MSPPITAVLWREVTAPEGLVVNGTWVPSGVDVGASIYAVHHNEDIFPDSFSFAPERWLRENTPSETLERMKKAFNPFSLGARRCVAQPMAYMELTLVLAKTLWYLDMRRPEGKFGDTGGGAKGASDGRDRIDEFQLREHFISHHDGPLLEFRCREGLTEELAALEA